MSTSWWALSLLSLITATASCIHFARASFSHAGNMFAADVIRDIIYSHNALFTCAILPIYRFRILYFFYFIIFILF